MSKSSFIGAVAGVVLLVAPGLAQATATSALTAGADPATTGATQGSGGSGASNASNYGSGTHFSVNSRTGGVSLQAPLFHLPGVRESISASLSLSYQSEDAVSDYEANVGGGTAPTVFGLPYGWSINLSYMRSKTVNGRSYIEVNIDGSQSYVFDSDWTTVNPATDTVVKIGLQQYNKADINFQQIENSSIVVNNLTATYQFANLNGTVRYLSADGLLIQEEDRFGNKIEYYYQCGVDPYSARLDYIVDTWQNRIDFSYPNNQPCAPIQGDVTVTLPDGRTVGYVVENEITQVIDPQGKITHLDWQNTNNVPQACGQYPLPTGVTTAGGMNSTVYYQCMNVCEATTSPNACSATNQVTQWPVALQLFECPGGTLPCGNGDEGSFWTTYTIGGTQSSSGLVEPDNNYTGFPYFSPFTPNETYPGSDPLMAAEGTAKFNFEYQTLVTRLNQGIQTYQTGSTYTFLHLLKESEIKVRAMLSNGFNGLATSKQVSHCYNLPGSDTAGCPLNSETINYESLPANYQSPTTTGSCVYSVGGVGTAGARVSVLTEARDVFGKTTNSRRYHGTSSSSVLTTECSRTTRLDPTPLKLVLDNYHAFDNPTELSLGYYVLGPKATNFGLRVGDQSFAYLDDDPGEFHGALGDTDGPIRVNLGCATLVGAGAAVPTGSQIATYVYGSLATTTTPPATVGTITACMDTVWDLSTAPPKLSALSYDSTGRLLSRELEWATVEAPGIASTTDTYAYAKATTNSDEAACAQKTNGQNASPVLQRTRTDSDGNVSVSRVCTLNNFSLSTTDPNKQITLFDHDATGLNTRITHSNGALQTYDYYYSCPQAPGGATCPSSVSACPHDTVSKARSCVVRTTSAGTGESYADGVTQATIKDGMGRVVEVRDNVGASDGSYGTWQTRLTNEYDNLGLMAEKTDLIGASDPLSYTTTFTYGAKLRPVLVCDPLGNAHEEVHDDVDQQTKKLHNGHQHELTVYNDSRRVVQLQDCPAGVNPPTAGTGACPAVASDVTVAACTGDVYDTALLLDGIGAQHSVTASNANAQAIGASVQSVTGQATLSAELLQYGYDIQTTPVNSESATTGAADWERDLHGKSLQHDVSVGTAFSNTPGSFGSDAFAYNELSQQVSETNKLSTRLFEAFTYTPTGQLCTRADYAGTTFTHFYDTSDRMTRFCHDAMICVGGSNDGAKCSGASECPSGACQAGSAGENFELDLITGKVLKVTQFTNPEACGSCTATPPTDADIAGNEVAMSYTRFGALESKTYKETIDTTPASSELQWAFDPYQRMACFADVMATTAGSTCPASPAATDWWQTSSAPFLTWYTYYPQSDPYRRGKLKATCRRDSTGTINCVERDYYTSESETGGCAADFANGENVTGAFAGLISQEQVCTGASSCSDSTATVLTTMQYEYDAHRRMCSVLTCQDNDTCAAGGGNLILGSTFQHDQYNNVITEKHQSDLDSSDASNYQISYVYDGLMRLLSSSRSTLQDTPIETITYRYDAASNIIQKTQTIVTE